MKRPIRYTHSMRKFSRLVEHAKAVVGKSHRAKVERRKYVEGQLCEPYKIPLHARGLFEISHEIIPNL